MNINTITQFNIVSKEHISNNRTNDFNNKRKRSDRILYYSLGGLAAIALGGLFYKNKSGIKKQNLIKVCTYQDLRQSTSSKQLSEVEAEAGRLNNELFKQFEISHDTDIFKRFVALMHLTDSKAVELPKMVITNAPESTLNDIGNLFSKDFKFEQRNLLYKSNPKDFIQKVKDVSNEQDNNVCIIINNFDNLINDLNNDKTLKQQFFDEIENSKNNIVFIAKVPERDSVNIYNKIFIPYKK